jgi:hypothetical protein
MRYSLSSERVQLCLLPLMTGLLGLGQEGRFRPSCTFMLVHHVDRQQVDNASTCSASHPVAVIPGRRDKQGSASAAAVQLKQRRKGTAHYTPPVSLFRPASGHSCLEELYHHLYAIVE